MTDQKPYGLPADAIPLSDAMKEFLPAEMWEAHARATEARKNAPKRPSYLSMSVRDWQDARIPMTPPTGRARRGPTCTASGTACSPQ